MENCILIPLSEEFCTKNNFSIENATVTPLQINIVREIAKQIKLNVVFEISVDGSLIQILGNNICFILLKEDGHFCASDRKLDDNIYIFGKIRKQGDEYVFLIEHCEQQFSSIRIWVYLQGFSILPEQFFRHYFNTVAF